MKVEAGTSVSFDFATMRRYNDELLPDCEVTHDSIKCDAGDCDPSLDYSYAITTYSSPDLTFTWNEPTPGVYYLSWRFYYEYYDGVDNTADKTLTFKLEILPVQDSCEHFTFTRVNEVNAV